MDDSAAPLIPQFSVSTDCEASGEYSESDSAAHETDTSEGITDSVATCLQGGGGSIQTGTSTEGLGSSVDPLTPPKDFATPIQTPIQIQKVVMRGNSRRSVRPWSVSCLSQLTPKTLSDVKLDQQVNQGLSNFSISESALDRACKNSSESNNDTTGNNTNTQSTIKSCDSKNSLKRKRLRMKKRSNSSVHRKSESGSDVCGLERSMPRSLSKPDSYAFQTGLVEDLTEALSMIQLPKELVVAQETQEKQESDEEPKLMAPAFKIGSITNVYQNLGPLAALSNYNRDVNEAKLDEAGTENMSSFSEQAEQAWDSYQEKYNSEAYSEDKDTDGARRLLDFGDDYRQFLDSQSDCCSSLSAANIDSSMSPPRFRKPMVVSLQNKSFSSTADSSLEVLRHIRTMELPETERKRMNGMEGEWKIYSSSFSYLWLRDL